MTIAEMVGPVDPTTSDAFERAFQEWVNLGTSDVTSLIKNAQVALNTAWAPLMSDPALFTTMRDNNKNSEIRMVTPRITFYMDEESRVPIAVPSLGSPVAGSERPSNVFVWQGSPPERFSVAANLIALLTSMLQRPQGLLAIGPAGIHVTLQAYQMSYFIWAFGIYQTSLP